MKNPLRRRRPSIPSTIPEEPAPSLPAPHLGISFAEAIATGSSTTVFDAAQLAHLRTPPSNFQAAVRNLMTSGLPPPTRPRTPSPRIRHAPEIARAIAHRPHQSDLGVHPAFRRPTQASNARAAANGDVILLGTSYIPPLPPRRRPPPPPPPPPSQPPTILPISPPQAPTIPPTPPAQATRAVSVATPTGATAAAPTAIAAATPTRTTRHTPTTSPPTPSNPLPTPRRRLVLNASPGPPPRTSAPPPPPPVTTPVRRRLLNASPGPPPRMPALPPPPLLTPVRRQRSANPSTSTTPISSRPAAVANNTTSSTSNRTTSTPTARAPATPRTPSRSARARNSSPSLPPPPAQAPPATAAATQSPFFVELGVELRGRRVWIMETEEERQESERRDRR